MDFKKIVLTVGLLTAGMGFAEPVDTTVATPGVLKVKLTVLDRETEQPLPYVKMGLIFNNSQIRIYRGIDLRTGADGVATREIPYDASANIKLDGAAYAGATSYAGATISLATFKTLELDPVDANGWNWNLDLIDGGYRVRRVVQDETVNMGPKDRTTHDDAMLTANFSAATGATVHFTCWLQRPAEPAAPTVTYDTALMQNADGFQTRTVEYGGTLDQGTETPVNAVWTTSAFTGWTVDGQPFDPASSVPIFFNLKLVPQWEGVDGEAFTLDTSCPKVDEPLTVEVAEGLGSPETLVYRWLRGDTAKAYASTPVSSTASYTPTAADYEHWFKFELEVVANGRTYPMGSKEFFFSKLPVLYMTTADGVAPAKDKKEHAGRLVVQGNALFDTTYDDDFTIHVRGNTTAEYPKLPYKIKLAEKTKMFGIAKNKHWVLLANYLDPSLVRNKIAYDFADVLGNKPAVQSTWVDCVLNGQWIGCYLFCEHLRIDKNRVDVYDWEGAAEDCAKALVKYYPDLKTALNGDKGPLEDLMKADFSWVTSGKVAYAGRDWAIDTTVFPDYSQNITGGYLFELSQEYDSISQWKVEKGKLVVPTMINAPEYLNSNAAMMQYCKDYWSQYWDAVRSPDGYAGGKHWKELCKLNSMVTYWLTMEIFGNNDASKKSRFAYKDVDDKLYFGPVWDFDWGMGSKPSDDTNSEQWKLMAWGGQPDSFYREWFDDPLFCTRAWEKYHEFRAQLGNLVAEGGILDQHKAYLQEAGNADSAKWSSMTWNPGSGNRIADRLFNQDIEKLRDFLSGRIEWLDQQFASVDALMNSLQNRAAECPNAPCASPYKRDNAKLPIAFKDVEPVADSPEKSVLHVAHEKGKDLEVSFTLGSGATSVASVETYVNGLIVGEGVPVTAGGAFYVKIPDEKMDAKAQEGQRDCVQFVARNASGGVVARNYALVSSIVAEPETPEDPPPSTNRKGTIKFRVHFWDQANYRAMSSATANPDDLKNNGRTTIPVDGLAFVLKSRADENAQEAPGSAEIPVGRPNSSEGWAQSRVEAKYEGLDEHGNEVWNATYEISGEQLQLLRPGWVIAADPDTTVSATYDLGLGWGPETTVFDWDRGVQGGNGTIPAGVREIPEGDRYNGNQPLGTGTNDVALITQDMIDNGFEFTFNCWVMPATAVPTIVKVKGPGTLTFPAVLHNSAQDSATKLSLAVDGGASLYSTSAEMSGYETQTLVFGGDPNAEHVVRVLFETAQPGAGTPGDVRLDQKVWTPFDTNIAAAVKDGDSANFVLENLGSDPATETSGVIFVDGVAQATAATVDYWYVGESPSQGQQPPAGGRADFATTSPTLSPNETTSFRVTGITGGSVVRWEALVTDGTPGETQPGDLAVSVTLTPVDGSPTVQVRHYAAADFENGAFSTEQLDFQNVAVTTRITLDFAYTNNGHGDGRAAVDNIYWRLVTTGGDGEGILSANAFGYLQMQTSTTNTMVAVPWTWYSYLEADATPIPADKLVKTTNLEEGDCLYAYSGAGAYLGWSIQNQDGSLAWSPMTTVTEVGGNAHVIVHDETGNNRTTLPRGAGVWLVRKDPTKPFWLYGQSVTTPAATTITPMGEGETAHSTMLGNPYAQAMCVSNLVFTGTVSTNDTIVIPNGTNSPMYLEYRNKGTKRNPSTEYGWVWVSLDTSVTPPKNVYNWDVTIPPGLAFWYVRRSTGDLSVVWPTP